MHVQNGITEKMCSMAAEEEEREKAEAEKAKKEKQKRKKSRRKVLLAFSC